ncbi:MAG: chemotaxis protein CheW [Candidatus Sedimenticola sp. (ex Thyasira tokunagai)]
MTEQSTQSLPDTLRENGSRQYLTFVLGDEEYAVNILKVREIRVWKSITAIPNTAAFIKGVINLRGTVVPIIDLRERFGLAARSYGPRTVVIVLSVEDGDHQRTMGLVVDAVSNVCTLTKDETSPPPDLGSAISAEFITGLATVDEKMLILLDSDRLLDLEEIYAIAQVQDREQVKPDNNSESIEPTDPDRSA